MSPLWAITSIVLVDLLGFTIVMPLLPRFAAEYGFDPVRIGLLLAAYPMMQLVAGPILGRLSDRYGRRPVLVVSQAGTALSFLILGLSRDYTVMLLARMLDGASGGNILVAQAYIADVTKPEHRSRGLGLIGAAFGVGFVLGPLLGALLVQVPVDPEWRLRLPFLVASGFSTLAWLLVVFRLPESRPEGAGRTTARVLSWGGLLRTVAAPRIGLLVAIGALVVLGFAVLEGTFSLYLKDRMGWDAGRAALGFAGLGLVSAIVQGGLIRRLVPRFGEPRLILTGILGLGLGLAGLAIVPASNTPALLGALLVVGIGQGLASPSVQGLLSKSTPGADQGGVFGTLSSAQTLARMASYLGANALLERFGTSAPFWGGAAVMAFALGLASLAVRLASGVKVDVDDAVSAGAAAPGG